MERFARHALFEDLQRGWSDARFVAERSGLEDQDVEDGQRDGQEEIRVVECEDRLEGFDPANPRLPQTLRRSFSCGLSVSVRLVRPTVSAT